MGFWKSRVIQKSFKSLVFDSWLETFVSLVISKTSHFLLTVFSHCLTYLFFRVFPFPSSPHLFPFYHMNSSYFWRQASISYIIYWNFLTSQFSYDMRISLSWQIRLLITIYPFFCLRLWNALLKAALLAFFLLNIESNDKIVSNGFLIPCVSIGLCSNH